MESSATSLEKLTANHPYEYRLFWSLDDDGDGLITKSEFVQVLENNGLTRKDPRLNDFFSALDDIESEAIDFKSFMRVIQSEIMLIEQVLQGDLALPDFANFSNEIKRLYTEVELNEEGNQATYIPPLAEVNPDQYALSAVSVDGQLLELGDYETDFSVQSACKPFNYCFATEELGAETVHDHIGMEPSGQAFNARILMSDGTGRPHNPMINAGAIMAAALIKSDKPLHKRLDHVKNMWSKMTGGSIPRFNAFMAQEESRTGDNNRALGYMMKAAGVLPKGEDAVDHELRDALELYFSICSLEINARELATAAATLANNGICPVTQERVFDESTVRNCLTLMQMCGMYDGSGEFSLHIGLPAKSGVGGAVILVVPRLMGICIWSPRLDPIGNSVRGVDMAKRLAKTYRLHVYDGQSERSKRIDPKIPAARLRARQSSQALKAANIGDLRTLQHLHGDNANLSTGDYDSRTPMHLAAAEGHTAVVRFLLENGVEVNKLDRWGGTALDEAELEGHEEVIELLQADGAEQGESKHVVSESTATEEVAQYGDTDAVVELLWAASENDMHVLRRCMALGIPVNAADYDGRTALHLAASEGHVEAVKYLLAHDHPIHVRDRWNATPLDDAKREQRDAVTEILTAAELAFHRLTISVDLKEITRATKFAQRYTKANDIAFINRKLGIVIDEVLAMIINHASSEEACSKIVIELDIESENFWLIVSSDGSEFDPLSDSSPDLEDEEMTGISIKLVRKFTNSVTFDRHDDRNILKLGFKLNEAAID